MKILFVHEVNYLTKPIYEMHEFPEHLASRGHEVGFVHFPEGFSRKRIKGLAYRMRIPGRVVEDVQLDLFTPWTASGSFSGRLLSSVAAFWQINRVLREFRPDIVVSFSVPTSGWQALIVARLRRVPFVFRALDASHKIRKGQLSDVVLAAEKFIYKHAPWLSANNPSMLDYCIGLSGRVSQSFVHYPPLDLNLFQSGSRSRGRALISLNDSERVVVYMGSFFYFSGLPDVLLELSLSDLDVILVLIGGGEQEAELRSLVMKFGLEERVIFTGMVPFESLPDLIASADVAINPMHVDLVSNIALPNKVLQYMASGVPVVSTDLKGLHLALGDDSGITWAGTPREAARLAFELCMEENKDSVVGAHKASLASFATATSVDKFEEFLERSRSEL